MNIRVLSASDRNNYGDILFPIIIKQYMVSKNIRADFFNYGIVRSNLNYYKGLSTKSMKDLKSDIKKSKNESIIIIAGGEVLGGGWLNIYRFVNDFWNKVNKIKYLRAFVNKSNLLNNYLSYSLGSSRPFILDGNTFNRNFIFYNTVGALGVKRLLKKKKFKKYFNEVGVLSIRDTVSKNNFDQSNVPNKLVPDSALIMSDILINDIIPNISQDCKDSIQEHYAFVQLAYDKAPDDLTKFGQTLNEFSKQNNLKILLCPIGLALDHWDDKVLKIIKKNNPNFIYFDPKNIYEIMFLIKNCSIYLGTSLHGLITAQSFVRPIFVFDEKVDKIKYYIDTWFENPESNYGDFYDLDSMNKKILEFDRETESKNTENQKKLIYANLSQIFNNV
jgi:hypothetical protein